jgi:hypothetical protein
VELHSIQMNVAKGPAFLVEDSPDAELDRIASRKLSVNEPVERILRSKGRLSETVAPSPMWESGVLLSVDSNQPGALRAEGLFAAKISHTPGNRPLTTEATNRKREECCDCYNLVGAVLTRQAL